MAPTSKDIANLHNQIKIIDSRNTNQDTTLASISEEISDIQVKNTNQDTTLASISKEISDIQVKNTNQDTTLANISKDISDIKVKNTNQDTTLANISKDISDIKVKNTNQDTTLANISKDIPTNFDIAKFKYLVETSLVFDGLTISFVNPSDPYPIGIIFDGIFNGTQIEAAGRGKYKYTFPTSAENWAGFANQNTSLYPFSFPFGGKIDFEAYVLDDVSIKFKFEKLPYPNTEPSFYTETKLITSSNRKYTIDISHQSNNTFSSFLLFLITRNKSIILSKVIVTAYDPLGIMFDGVFGNAQFEGVGIDTYKYTFPTSAEVWAGFANQNTSLYPFSFPFGGKIDFEAYVLDDVSIKFKFEKLPYPNTEPSFYTETKLITSKNRKYTIDILPQSNKTFSSFLLYLITRDKPIILSKVFVTAYEADPNFIDIDSIVKDFSFFGLDWVYEVGPIGSWSNNEKQAYTKDQVEISNNSLKIKIQRQADNTINSSRIVSFYTNNDLTLERNYSIKITFMAKMPKSYDVNGNILDPETVPLWPALWLMGQEFWTKKETWPSCGEIDVLEWTPTASTNIGTFTQKSVFNALHYAGGESIKNLYESVVDLIDNFNNYSTKLYRYSNDVGNKIEFYFNDILIKSHILTSNQDELVISNYGNKKFGLIMNIAYQGDFTSNIDNIAFNNATMEISNISIEKNRIE